MESQSTLFPPNSILIVGSGVFGLSTALALTKRPAYSNVKITVLDRSHFPAPDGSSIDTSRIIRADHSSPPYAQLAATAQSLWRSTSGLSTHYHESGLVLVADKGAQGQYYVRESFSNVLSLSPLDSQGPHAIQELPSRKDIDAEVGTGGGSGDWGYVNRRSGWADAEGAMRWLRDEVEATGRITFFHGEAISLIKSPTVPSIITGTLLKSGKEIHADLVILATGAWTPSLVDLSGRATATGQCLAYIDISPEEQEKLKTMPVLLNLSTGLFVIPPTNNLLKIARHSYGYTNPVSIPNPDICSSSSSDNPAPAITISLPRTGVDNPDLQIPREGAEECRAALKEMVPFLADRPFRNTRLCWYTDTPDGNFLITYHPEFKGLFLATGGCGHGFKFLPVIGDAIADCVEGHCPQDFEGLWAWPKQRVETVITEDGSRGGKPGLVLDEELRRG